MNYDVSLNNIVLLFVASSMSPRSSKMESGGKIYRTFLVWAVFWKLGGRPGRPQAGFPGPRLGGSIRGPPQDLVWAPGQALGQPSCILGRLFRVGGQLRGRPGRA